VDLPLRISFRHSVMQIAYWHRSAAVRPLVQAMERDSAVLEMFNAPS
jgi:hypothetical protein